MGISLYVTELMTTFIESAGYWAVFIGMVLESMVFPIPSEAVMPFAGFIIAEGGFSWLGVGIISTLASVIGSLLSYAMGRYGGRPFIDRYGKYFLLDKVALARAEDFFRAKGGRTIFFCRFIPVVRHVSSLPAGIAKMPLLPFILLTAAGASLWNLFLTGVGYHLRHNWEIVHEYGEVLDLIVLLLLLGFVFWTWRKKKKHDEKS